MAMGDEVAVLGGKNISRTPSTIHLHPSGGLRQLRAPWSILRRRRTDYVSCPELRSRCPLDAVLSILLQRQLKWFGHAARGRRVDTKSASGATLLLGHIKSWTATLKKGIAMLSGPT